MYIEAATGRLGGQRPVPRQRNTLRHFGITFQATYYYFERGLESTETTNGDRHERNNNLSSDASRASAVTNKTTSESPHEFHYIESFNAHFSRSYIIRSYLLDRTFSLLCI